MTNLPLLDSAAVGVDNLSETQNSRFARVA